MPWARAVPYCSGFVNLALHPFGVTKSSTSFGWGKGRNVTSAGWQVTLCDPIWHVSSHSGEAGLLTKGEPLYRIYFSYFIYTKTSSCYCFDCPFEK